MLSPLILFRVLAFFSATGGTISSESLWQDLYATCAAAGGSFYCVQNKLTDYINDTLNADLHVTEGIYFVKNRNRASHRFDGRQGRSIADEEDFIEFVQTVEDIEKVDEALNANVTLIDELHGHGNSTNTTIAKESAATVTIADAAAVDSGTNIRSLESVTDLLYDKAADYFTTHDLNIALPETFFGGSTIRVSPIGYDADGGIIVKLKNLPGNSDARLFGMGKFIHKMFKKKLLQSLLALLLIIKLIKLKLMYVLPLIIGVGAAKKLLLKTLLFLFPPLVHLFKLCSYYHKHAHKIHYHHNKIKHHHHHIKVPVPVPVAVPVHQPHYDEHGHDYEPYPEHHGYDGGGGGGDSGHHTDYYGLMGLTPDHSGYTRNDMSNLAQNADEMESWGLKDFYASTESPGVLSAQAQAFSPYAEQPFKQSFQTRITPIDPLQAAYKKIKAQNAWKTNKNVAPKVKLVTYDPFFSPILQKIDTLFTQLGFHEEGCRERLICSMYKNPSRYSPHSNLLSTELSRDPNELEKASYTSIAAVRFYRYVEAARDGQAQKGCLEAYADCSVKTE